jgi:hypothetical protein
MLASHRPGCALSVRVPHKPSGDLPVGRRLRFYVQLRLQKYFGSLLTQITSTSSAVPAHTKGRFAIVTNVGQGMRWTRLALLTNSADVDGEVVWTWRQGNFLNYFKDKFPFKAAGPD